MITSKFIDGKLFVTILPFGIALAVAVLLVHHFRHRAIVRWLIQTRAESTILKDRLTSLESIVIPYFAREILKLRESLQENSVDPLASFVAEDGIDILIQALVGHIPCGRFLEIGAYDGLFHSNTYRLEATGWTGVLIEASPDLRAKIVKNRPNSRVVIGAVVCGPESTTKFNQVEDKSGPLPGSYTTTNDSHVAHCLRNGCTIRSFDVPTVSLSSSCLNTHYDVLAIDTNGCEVEILRALDIEKMQPSLVIVSLAIDGSSRVHELLKAENYKPIATYCGNALFAPPEQATHAERTHASVLSKIRLAKLAHHGNYDVQDRLL